MTDSIPQFEMADKVGTTDTFTGTVTTTAINLPTIASTYIDEIGIRCTIDQPFASRLEFSYDGGTNWFRLCVGESSHVEPRGNITQVKIRAAGTLTTCKYEVIMNRGPA